MERREFIQEVMGVSITGGSISIESVACDKPLLIDVVINREVGDYSDYDFEQVLVSIKEALKDTPLRNIPILVHYSDVKISLKDFSELYKENK